MGSRLGRLDVPSARAPLFRGHEMQGTILEQSVEVADEIVLVPAKDEHPIKKRGDHWGAAGLVMAVLWVQPDDMPRSSTDVKNELHAAIVWSNAKTQFLDRQRQAVQLALGLTLAEVLPNPLQRPNAHGLLPAVQHNDAVVEEVPPQ